MVDRTVLSRWPRLACAGACLLFSAHAARGQTASGHGWRPGQDWAACAVIEVRDLAGRPVAGATVTRWSYPPGSQRFNHGQSWTTDRRGRICEAELLHGAYLDVHAPEQLGGACAAAERLDLPAWDPSTSSPPAHRVVLDIKPPPRTSWHGRVIDERGRPVPRALISVRAITWAAADGSECAVTPDLQVSTTASGAFQLPHVPHGRLRLDISSAGHAEREFTTTVPGPSESIVLDRGVTLRGRVLTPDGSVVDSCSIWLETSFGRLRTASCSASGFTLNALPPGRTKLRIRVQDHAVLGTRLLERQLELQPRTVLVQDILFPAGESISGQVTTAQGQPLAGVTVSALPKGADRFANSQAREVRVVSDGLGRFTFQHLAPGSWLLWTLPLQGSAGREVTTGTAGVRLTVP